MSRATARSGEKVSVTVSAGNVGLATAGGKLTIADYTRERTAAGAGALRLVATRTVSARIAAGTTAKAMKFTFRAPDVAHTAQGSDVDLVVKVNQGRTVLPEIDGANPLNDTATAPTPLHVTPVYADFAASITAATARSATITLNNDGTAKGKLKARVRLLAVATPQATTGVLLRATKVSLSVNAGAARQRVISFKPAMMPAGSLFVRLELLTPGLIVAVSGQPVVFA